jgi:hypothetical protein
MFSKQEDAVIPVAEVKIEIQFLGLGGIDEKHGRILGLRYASDWPLGNDDFRCFCGQNRKLLDNAG